jgi:hypothetical protein
MAIKPLTCWHFFEQFIFEVLNYFYGVNEGNWDHGTLRGDTTHLRHANVELAKGWISTYFNVPGLTDEFRRQFYQE